MKFSIIVPVYNAEKFIESTITQTLMQSFLSFELLLVDDGSEDETGRICDRYAEKYPEKLRVVHQENQGQLAARCSGIRAARGEYCLFLDADDALAEDCLSEMQALLAQYDNPDIVIYSFRYVNEDGASRPAKKLYDGEWLYQEKSELYPYFLTTTLLNNVWTKLVKREVLLRCRIDMERFKSLRCSEDRLHSMEMLTQAQTVLYTSREWYRYCLVAGSVTREYTPAAICRFNDSILYGITEDYLKKWGMNTEPWQNRLQASWSKSSLYVLDRFYYGVRPSQRGKVLAYPWLTFLPEELPVSRILENPELKASDKYLWKCIRDGSYHKMRFHFLKKSAYKAARNLKRRLFDKKESEK